MKKIFNWLICASLLIIAGSCASEDIFFDHEQPAFETRDGRILMEVVVPTTTSADDIICISGEFNGADDKAALNNPGWHLEKSAKNPSKWGIYLDPNTFSAGKTLADGYYFVSAANGREMGVTKNDTIVRTNAPAPGTRTTLYVKNWASSFEETVFPKHSGYRVYVYDDTKWDAIALYQYGAINDYGGKWPGSAVAGKYTFNGLEYKYFDFGEDAAGLAQMFILNNNGNGIQLPDYPHTFGEAKDIFLYVDAKGVSAIEDPLTFTVEIPEVKLFLTNNAGWKDIRLYAEEQGNPVAFGNWPGAEPEVLEGQNGEADTLYYAIPAEAYGKTLDLVFNTSDGTYLPDYTIVADHDYNLILNPTEVRDPQAVRVYINDQTGWEKLAMYAYEGETPVSEAWPGYEFKEKVTVDGIEYYAYTFPYTLYGKTVSLIFNDTADIQTTDYAVNLSRDTFINLTADGVETAEVKIYFIDESGWERTCLYAWGDAEVFGGWPGADVTGTEVIFGKEYKYVLVPASGYGKAVNLIFNNGTGGDGYQFDAAAVILDKDFYYTITNSSAAEVNPESKSVSIYAGGENGWANTYLYAYGTAEIFGGWPGALPAETISFCGVPYRRYEVSADYFCSEENLIFNNNSGVQFDGPFLTMDKDYFLSITESSATVLETNPAMRIYIEDNTGWEAITLYCWGDSEVFGGWPGALPGGTQNVGGKEYKYFDVPANVYGQTVNIIFNNNNGGIQIEGKEAQVSLKLNKDYFYTVSADDAVFAE